MNKSYLRAPQRGSLPTAAAAERDPQPRRDPPRIGQLTQRHRVTLFGSEPVDGAIDRVHPRGGGAELVVREDIRHVEELNSALSPNGVLDRSVQLAGQLFARPLLVRSKPGAANRCLADRRCQLGIANM